MFGGQTLTAYVHKLAVMQRPMQYMRKAHLTQLQPASSIGYSWLFRLFPSQLRWLQRRLLVMNHELAVSAFRWSLTRHETHAAPDFEPMLAAQVSVGIGTLAGSTIMLLTVAWGGSLLAGRCDLNPEVGAGVFSH